MRQLPENRETRSAQIKQFVRFLLVGLMNTAFGYGIYAAAFLATHSQTTGIIFGNVVGMIFNYISIGRLVFGARKGSAPRFFLAYAVILALNLILAEALRRLSVEGLLSQFLLLPILVIVSYALNSLYVFPRSNE